MKKLICWIFGHDYDWRLVPVYTRLGTGKKWRGTCLRCGDWKTCLTEETVNWWLERLKEKKS